MATPKTTKPGKTRTTRNILLERLVDELIPGDERWPSASSVGVHDAVMLRLFSKPSSLILEQSLDCSSGGLLSAALTTRAAVVRRFADTHPALFEKIYTAAVLAYYEMPAVVETIRGGGRPYSKSPHEDGYAMPAFDLERDKPRHGRGSYLRTEDVKPLDLSSLDLDTVATTRWGLVR